MGDVRVRQTGRAQAPPTQSTPPTPTEAEPPSPDQVQRDAADALDAARDRTRTRRRSLPPPRLRLPEAEAPRLLPGRELRGPGAAGLDLRVRPEPPPTLREAEAERLQTELEPPERRDLVEALGEAMADDAVEKLDAVVSLLNRIRTRRNERRVGRGEEPRAPVDVDREAVRGWVERGSRAGIEAGLEWLLEHVLEAAFGEPAERPDLSPDSPAEVERLHPDERRLYLRTPPISF